MGAVTTLMLTILGVFARDLHRKITIRQIAGETGKPYANTHAAVTRLIKRGILAKQTIGHSHLCTLNTHHPETPLLISLWHARQTEEPPRIDDPNILLVFRRKHDNLYVTKEPCRPTRGGTWRAYNEITDREWAVLGRDLLIYGHAAYAALLAQRGGE